MSETDVWKDARRALNVPVKYGFIYEYGYTKVSDSSCVYVHAFKKGRDRFELRAVSGSNEINAVAFVGGEYRFPDLKRKYEKLWKKAKRKRTFRRMRACDTWDFIAEALEEEAASGAFFGIAI